VGKQERKEQTPTRPADYEHGRLLNPASRTSCGRALILAMAAAAIRLGRADLKELQKHSRNSPSRHHDYGSCSLSLACTHHQHQ